MGQVPVRYGLVGDGRLAKHLAFYFQELNISSVSWSRKSLKPLTILHDVDVLLLALSDGAILPFVEDAILSDAKLAPKKRIHFSGSLTTPLCPSFHPLMTFGDELYDLKVYEKISFIVEPAPWSFAEIFPALNNRSFVVPAEERTLYHSFCVLSGNFMVLLWEKFFKKLENDFKIPRSAAFPYLERVTANLLAERDRSALTGPLARDDQETINKNIKSLEGDAYQGVYEAFVTAFRAEDVIQRLQAKENS